jgi:hypothetical protein
VKAGNEESLFLREEGAGSILLKPIECSAMEIIDVTID